MMRTMTVLLLACLALSPTTLAAECNGTITKIIVEDGSGGGQGLYIDDRSDALGEINHWVYLENNAQQDLQSGGSNDICGKDCLPVTFFDSCFGYGPAGPDLLIF